MLLQAYFHKASNASRTETVTVPINHAFECLFVTQFLQIVRRIHPSLSFVHSVCSCYDYDV